MELPPALKLDHRHWSVDGNNLRCLETKDDEGVLSGKERELLSRGVTVDAVSSSTESWVHEAQKCIEKEMIAKQRQSSKNTPESEAKLVLILAGNTISDPGVLNKLVV